MGNQGPDRFTIDFTGARLLDHYQVERRLGEGGMATVYLARDTRLARPVVVKVPHARFLGEPGFRERFEHEIRSLVGLRHPHVVSILDRGEHDGVPFYVLEYLAGGSLKDRLVLAPDRRLPPETLLPWFRTLGETLDFMHAQGTVHRDVKPDNVLFDEHGHPFVSDFGIVKALGRPESGVTQTGQAVGSPVYMAPEQVGGDAVTGAADQYALAASLFEALAGAPAFPGETPIEILVKKATAGPPDVASRLPTLGAGATAAIRRSLSSTPAERYATCVDFVRAFEAGLDMPPAPPLDPAPPAEAATAAPRRTLSPRARRAVVAGAAVIGVVLIAILVFGGGEGRRAKERLATLEARWTEWKDGALAPLADRWIPSVPTGLAAARESVEQDPAAANGVLDDVEQGLDTADGRRWRILAGASLRAWERLERGQASPALETARAETKAAGDGSTSPFRRAVDAFRGRLVSAPPEGIEDPGTARLEEEVRRLPDLRSSLDATIAEVGEQSKSRAENLAGKPSPEKAVLAELAGLSWKEQRLRAIQREVQPDAVEGARDAAILLGASEPSDPVGPVLREWLLHLLLELQSKAADAQRLETAAWEASAQVHEIEPQGLLADAAFREAIEKRAPMLARVLWNQPIRVVTGSGDGDGPYLLSVGASDPVPVESGVWRHVDAEGAEPTIALSTVAVGRLALPLARPWQGLRLAPGPESRFTLVASAAGAAPEPASVCSTLSSLLLVAGDAAQGCLARVESSRAAVEARVTAANEDLEKARTALRDAKPGDRSERHAAFFVARRAAERAAGIQLGLREDGLTPEALASAGAPLAKGREAAERQEWEAVEAILSTTANETERFDQALAKRTGPEADVRPAGGVPANLAGLYTLDLSEIEDLGLPVEVTAALRMGNVVLSLDPSGFYTLALRYAGREAVESGTVASAGPAGPFRPTATALQDAETAPTPWSGFVLRVEREAGTVRFERIPGADGALPPVLGWVDADVKREPLTTAPLEVRSPQDGAVTADAELKLEVYVAEPQAGGGVMARLGGPSATATALVATGSDGQDGVVFTGTLTVAEGDGQEVVFVYEAPGFRAEPRVVRFSVDRTPPRIEAEDPDVIDGVAEASPLKFRVLVKDLHPDRLWVRVGTTPAEPAAIDDTVEATPGAAERAFVVLAPLPQSLEEKDALPVTLTAVDAAGNESTFPLGSFRASAVKYHQKHAWRAVQESNLRRAALHYQEGKRAGAGFNPGVSGPVERWLREPQVNFDAGEKPIFVVGDVITFSVNMTQARTTDRLNVRDGATLLTPKGRRPQGGSAFEASPSRAPGVRRFNVEVIDDSAGAAELRLKHTVWKDVAVLTPQDFQRWKSDMQQALRTGQGDAYMKQRAGSYGVDAGTMAAISTAAFAASAASSGDGDWASALLGVSGGGIPVSPGSFLGGLPFGFGN